jgi:hypothetical protein
MKPVFIAACTVILLSGCGPQKPPYPAASPNASPPASTSTAPQARNATSREQLPDLARGLVPAAEQGSLAGNDLSVKTCGISPTFPCIDTFFSLAGSASLRTRLSLLSALAKRSGWTVQRIQPLAAGAHLDLVRTDVHARYTLGRGLAGSITQLQVFGPQNALPTPSAAERARWGIKKRRFVRQADAICARFFGSTHARADFTRDLTKMVRSLEALPPPSREEQAVQTFLDPLEQMQLAAEALAAAQGEEALPATVALGEASKQFSEAASRYGLERCALGR